MVTSATTNPPIIPPIIHGIAASGVNERPMPQVHAEVTTTHNRSRPVLLTVPCNVMASPIATWPLNAFSFRAGLEVLIRFAIAEVVFLQEFLNSGPSVHLNSTTRL